MKKRILSGNRPTGRLHLGNLVGALNNWVSMQDDYECFFEVADWHVLTTKNKEANQIKENTVEMVLDWISCGIDPVKSTVFVQSGVIEHAELHLLLSMLATVPRLERNPTYKEMVTELNLGDQVSYGLLGYPVLQAADILIYRANLVPVGEDQLPHIEFCREIARRFNYLYGETFPLPDAKLSQSKRLVGLDGRKMSKSYENAIFLADSPDQIKSKVWNIITDPKRVRLKDPGDPEVCNAYALYKAFAFELHSEVAQQCREAQRGCTQCKKQLTTILIDFLAPLRKRRIELQKNIKDIEEILATGTEKAREEAQKTMDMVRENMQVGGKWY